MCGIGFGEIALYCEELVQDKWAKAIRREIGITKGSNGLSAPVVLEDGVENEERVELDRREGSHHEERPRARALHGARHAACAVRHQGRAPRNGMARRYGRRQIEEVGEAPPVGA